VIEAVDRMPRFVGRADDADSRAALADTTVLLAGIGSVGGRIAEHCGRCHIGEVALVDGKRFGAGFDTQVIRSAADVGRFKASRVGRWIRDVSPQTTVHALDTPLEALPLWMLDDYDVVIASTDNLGAEVEIGRRCLALGIPLIYASVHGPTLTVQMRTFTNRGPDCPCPACGFSAGEWRQLDSQIRFSCAPEAGDAVARVDGQPTSSVSPLCRPWKTAWSNTTATAIPPRSAGWPGIPAARSTTRTRCSATPGPASRWPTPRCALARRQRGWSTRTTSDGHRLPSTISSSRRWPRVGTAALPGRSTGSCAVAPRYAAAVVTAITASFRIRSIRSPAVVSPGRTGRHCSMRP
jgi:molybdopterin/thiamine biosynthesis adenylyltransferase